MNKRIFSNNLYRILVIAALVIPLALGAISPAKAAAAYTVTGWGWNGYGQINIPSELTNVVAIDAGFSHSLALKSDGTVVAWGANNYGQTNIPTDLTGVVAISADYYHNLALKSDGTVVAWGWNNYGQSDVPSDLADVVAIDTGEFHNLALRAMVPLLLGVLTFSARPPFLPILQESSLSMRVMVKTWSSRVTELWSDGDITSTAKPISRKVLPMSLILPQARITAWPLKAMGPLSLGVGIAMGNSMSLPA